MATEAASLFVTLGARTSAFTTQMNAAEGRMQTFQKNANLAADSVVASAASSSGKVARSWENASAKMRTAGSRMSREITAPMAIIGGIATKMAMDYEKSVNKIATLSSGSAKDVMMLRNEVLRLGGQTAKTPQQLADALYIIESGGIHGANAMKVLTASAKASAVGLGEAAVIARGVTAAVNAYAGSGLSAADATNTLAQAVKEGMVPTDELVGTIGRLISVTGYMRISFQSTMAAVAGLTRTGLSAQVATNQLRMVLIGFQKPTDKVQEALHSVGLTAEQVRDSFSRLGIQATMEMLWAAAGKGAKNVDEQKAKYVEFFQAIARGGSAALSLVGGNMAANDAIARRMATSVDVVGASFERLRKQPGFQLQAGLQQAKNDLIILGEVILPLVAPAIVKVANAIQSALTTFRSFSPPVQTAILAVVGLVAALGPMLTLIGNLSALMSPWTLVIAAVAAGAFLIIKNWSTVGPVIRGTFNDVRSAVGGTITWLTNAWKNLTDWVTNAWRNTTGWINKAWQNVTNYVGPSVRDLGTIFRTAFSVMSAIMTPFVNVLRAVIPAAVSVAMAVLRPLAKFVGETLGGAFTLLVKVVTGTMKALASVMSGGFDVIRGILRVFAGLFTLDFKKMWDGVKLIFQGAVKMLVGILNGAFNLFYNAGKFIINAVGNGIKAAVSGVLGVIVGFLNLIVGVLNKIPGVSVGKIATPHFEQGGIAGVGLKAGTFATGGVVNRPGYFAGEEAPAHPEVILATNPRHRKRNLDLWATAGGMLGVPGFAIGGVFGDIAKTVGNFTGISKVVDLISSGGDILSGIAKPKLPGWISGLPDWVLSQVGKWVAGQTKGIVSAVFGGGGAVSGNVANWIAQAMALTGVSGSLWAQMLARQISRESGGNPNAINKTDINWQSGNPSIGLMQTTIGTFGAYHLPGHASITNPVDNIAAAIRYIIAVYGGGDANRGAEVMWARGGGAYAEGGIYGNGTLTPYRAKKPTKSPKPVNDAAKIIAAKRKASIPKGIGQTITSLGKFLAGEPGSYGAIRNARMREQDLMDRFSHTDMLGEDFVSLVNGVWTIQPTALQDRMNRLHLMEETMLKPAAVQLFTEGIQTRKAIKDTQDRIKTITTKTIATIKARIAAVLKEIKQKTAVVKSEKIAAAKAKTSSQKTSHTVKAIQAQNRINDLTLALGKSNATGGNTLYGLQATANTDIKRFRNTGVALADSISYFGDERKLGDPSLLTPSPIVGFLSIPARGKTLSDALESVHREMATVISSTATTATAAAPVEAAATATSTATALDTTLVNTLKAQLQQAQALVLTSQAQAGVLAGVGAGIPTWSRFLGSFASGIANVPMEGLAYLHRGEAVVPAALNTPGSYGGQSQVTVILHGDAERFRKDVEVVVDGKTAEIVESANGQLGFRVGTGRQSLSSPGRVARY